MNTELKRDKKMGNKNFILLSVAFIILVLAITSLTSAYFWACLDKGEKAYYCNDYKPPRTCNINSGCQLCMKSYDEANNCYIHQFYEDCYSIPQECGLGGGGGGGIDSLPPVLTVTNPTQGLLSDSRKVDVGFTLDESADVFYLDVINGRGRWSKICANCESPYAKGVSFDEGQNTIRFRAVDDYGNEAFSSDISFMVDSKKPKIKKTLPKKGFSDGEFYVEFQESNPTTLTLFYGNNGSSSVNVPLSNCQQDDKSPDKYSCTMNVDLNPYNGQEINYWFSLTDIVGNNVNSKPVNVMVDLTPPAIMNPGDLFTYTNGTKYVYFHLNINEENFDEVIYSYFDSKGKFKESTLCSRLKEGMCEKKLTFREGEWHLTLSVFDDAGNSIAVPAEFIVDY